MALAARPPTVVFLFGPFITTLLPSQTGHFSFHERTALSSQKKKEKKEKNRIFSLESYNILTFFPSLRGCYLHNPDPFICQYLERGFFIVIDSLSYPVLRSTFATIRKPESLCPLIVPRATLRKH